jgi:hypothetical protein
LISLRRARDLLQPVAPTVEFQAPNIVWVLVAPASDDGLRRASTVQSDDQNVDILALLTCT